MRFKYKINLVLLIIIVILPLAALFYYRKTHPKYIPPPPRQEINITIIPGWDLRDIAADWIKKGLIKTPEELYNLVGQPAYNYSAYKKIAPDLNLVDASGTQQYSLLATKPKNISYEGFLYPDTYRVYADAKPVDVLKKVFSNLENKITPDMRAEITRQGKSFYDVLILASVVEKEAPSNKDMGMVADIFERRLNKNWALQSCATVNYITGKHDPAASGTDKSIDSLFNTYKYPGLPLGAISSPSVNAIQAVLYPIKNNYWYFMAGTDGVTHYATTLDEHNINVAKYLR